jgi:Rad3-related DNA helicase
LLAESEGNNYEGNNYEVTHDRAKIWASDGFEYLDDTNKKHCSENSVCKVYLRCRYYSKRKCAGRAKVLRETDELVVTRKHVCHLWLAE